MTYNERLNVYEVSKSEFKRGNDYDKQYKRVKTITEQLKKLRAKLRRERAILICLSNKNDQTCEMLNEDPWFVVEGL